MLNRIKLYFTIFSFLVLAGGVGCKKGTFDINSPNPNSPSNVSPQFNLSAALVASANSMLGNGYSDFAQGWMGYWAFSGDYGGYGPTATYNINSNYATGNWDYVYNTVLVNYKLIEKVSSDPNEANYLGISKIMQAFHFARLVDLYNNVPYSDALNGGVQNYPKYDDAKSVYTSAIHQLDSGLVILAAASANADNPGKYDVMFGGHMDMWEKFGNTVKLKILLNLTQSADGPALIQSELATNPVTGAAYVNADFLEEGEDAAVNPGYSNSSAAQQNPQWANVGFTTGGAAQTNHQFYRADSYAVNFYNSTQDPRLTKFYDLNTAGVVRGRAYGSQDGSEHNAVISPVGPGILKSPGQDADILPAFESLFFQAEATQRGYITGGRGTEDLYDSAISESFRLLFDNDPSYHGLATAYYSQAGVSKVNFTAAPDKITLIITQEWAALNGFDPVTAWNNWKRLGIPADIPVSIYPGTTASHIPIRLLYPASEFTTNVANVTAQGTIDIFSSKIFWMP